VTGTTSLAELRQRLHALGANDDHVAHLLRAWLHARPLDSGRRRAEHFLPRRVRDVLPALADELASLARLQHEHHAADGAVRLLLALHDTQTVEAVLLPAREGARGAHGLCVSTQVGCAVGCTFCKTGEGGLARQMGSAELAAQLALARTLRPVNKVVFMGMGEPAHNLDAVLEAIDVFGHEGGIGHKNLVLSTVGDARLFDRLIDRTLARRKGEVLPALALSLHSTDDGKRQALLPRAPRLPVRELIDAAEGYARASAYPLQIQWTLIDGVNDADDEVDALAALLRGRHAILNMIPYNAVDGAPYRRPTKARCDAIFHALNRRGVLTRMRQSAGQDVDAGCGQLRSRTGVAAAAAADRAHAVVAMPSPLSRPASSP
jgi:23S rRNA (adenine2503-C2)-methyltransferase